MDNVLITVIFCHLKFMLTFSLMHPSEGPGTHCVEEITVPLASEMVLGCCNVQNKDVKAQRLESWKNFAAQKCSLSLSCVLKLATVMLCCLRKRVSKLRACSHSF